MLAMEAGVKRRPPRRVHGFTIIELLMVMVILTVTLSIVAPRFQMSASRRVEVAAGEMVARLELARSHALGQRQITRIVFDETAGTYTAYVDHDRDGNITESANEVTAFPEFGDRSLRAPVEFGRGNALAIPGDPSPEAVTLMDNTLDLSAQGVPEPWGTMGTVYLVHRDDRDAVSAISFASSGSFTAWRWAAGSGEWQ